VVKEAVVEKKTKQEPKIMGEKPQQQEEKKLTFVQILASKE